MLTSCSYLAMFSVDVGLTESYLDICLYPPMCHDGDLAGDREKTNAR